MKKLSLIVLLSTIFFPSFAALTGKCTPSGTGAGYSGTTTFCAGATASALTFNYSECSSGSGTASGVSCTATWYYNTTNTTTISSSTVLVAGPTTFTSAAGVNGNLPTVTPITTTAGTYYYFCVVKWTVAGTCTSPYTTPAKLITINAAPSAINGASSVCQGGTITLSDVYDGGTWSTANTSDATINSYTGVVTGVAGSTTTTIAYTLGTGCKATKSIAVNPLPGSITGTTSVCMGATTTLNDATTGGTWSSSNTAIATVTSAHVVSGLAAGTANILYTLSTGCMKSVAVTVNQGPAAINGTNKICVGSTTTLTDTYDGGLWSSSNTANVSIGSATGVVSGVAGSTSATIAYTLMSNGCKSTMTLSVTPMPATISGNMNICSGTSTTLSNTLTGGTWSCSNPESVAVAASTGVVTGVSGGTSIITYSLGGNCYTTKTMTINAAPYITSSAILPAIKGTSSTALKFHATGSPANYNIAWSSAAHSAGFTNATSSPLTSDTAIAISVPTTVAAATYVGTLSLSSTGCTSQTATISAIVNDSFLIYTYAGTGANGNGGNGGAATVGQISHPSSVASDCNGNTYIADYDNGVVRKVDATGTISIFAGNGTIGYSGDGGAATAAQLSNPTGVAIDGYGNVYIADYNNMVVRKVNTEGIISTFAGNGAHGYSGNGGAATSAELNYPVGLAVDNENNVYIADYLNSVIRKVNTSGIISTVAGNGTAGYSGNGGAATSANLSNPRGVAVDAAGNMYITDYGNNMIREVNASGIISTIAGTGAAGYSGDGNMATAATLNNPWGIAVDANKNIYFSELHNNVIRKIDSTGAISTVAGNYMMGAGFSGNATEGINAQLDQPMGIAINCSGNLFIADNANYAVRILGTYNRAPFFTGGATQSLFTFASAPTLSLNMNLEVVDYDSLQNDTWTLASAPSNGTASIHYAVHTSGSTLVPAGLTYTAAAGFSGLDSFTVQVTDGKAIATTKLYVTVSAVSDRMANTGITTTTLSSVSLQVFPNPSKGNFNINTSEAGTFTLLSMEGQSVGDYNVTSGQTSLSMPSGLPSGMYVGRFKNADGNATEIKIVYEP